MNDDEGELQELNLPPPQERLPRIDLEPISHKQEKVRGRIAYQLIWILAGVLLLSFILLFLSTHQEIQTGDAETEVIRSVIREDLIEVLKITIPPLITLIGTVCGFYFGGNPEKLGHKG